MEDANKKQMCLNRNAWHRKLNKWTYGEGYVETWKWDEKQQKHVKTDKQKNGCEYFWGTVLAVTFCWFTLICKGVSRGFNWVAERTPTCNYRLRAPSLTWEQEEKAKQLVAAFFMVLFTVGFFTGVIYGQGAFLTVIGVVVGAIGGLIVLVFALWSAHDSYRESHPKKYKEKKPNPIWTYLKARKQKACPCICWEDK